MVLGQVAGRGSQQITGYSVDDDLESRAIVSATQLKDIDEPVAPLLDPLGFDTRRTGRRHGARPCAVRRDTRTRGKTWQGFLNDVWQVDGHVRALG